MKCLCEKILIPQQKDAEEVMSKNEIDALG